MTDTQDTQKEIPEILPVLLPRNIVVLPAISLLFVGREKSIRALEEVMADDKEMLLVSQRDGDQDEPTRRMHWRWKSAQWGRFCKCWNCSMARCCGALFGLKTRRADY